jgi:rfaE bifunctional protein kinase chain/domain
MKTTQLLPSREMIAGCRILVVGDVMLDRYWYGNVKRFSAEAPVPIVHIQREEFRLGGAANVALNVKTLGSRVTLMSMVGQDAGSRNLRDLLANHGIETYLSEDSKMETITKLRVISNKQQMLRIDFEKEPDHDVLATMVENFKTLIFEHNVVLFSDYGKGSLVHIQRMIQIARNAGKPVFIDPKGIDWARYSGATAITPNRAELAQVVGMWANEAQLQTKAQALLRKLNLEALLVTRSEDGMTLIESGLMKSIFAETREVSDVTGAGDTVIATLALMVACGLDLPNSMILANRAAGIVVAKFGTSSLSYEELLRKSANET